MRTPIWLRQIGEDMKPSPPSNFHLLETAIVDTDSAVAEPVRQWTRTGPPF
jgi:hypothetical protein